MKFKELVRKQVSSIKKSELVKMVMLHANKQVAGATIKELVTAINEGKRVFINGRLVKRIDFRYASSQYHRHHAVVTFADTGEKVDFWSLVYPESYYESYDVNDSADIVIRK